MDRIDALRLFAAVADAESFAAGTRQVGASAASATRGEATLEDRLGVKLFNRTTRAVRLTEAGRDYLARIGPIPDDLAQTDASASGAGTRLAGRLQLTGPVRIGAMHLMPVLSNFLDAHPDVTAEAIFVDRVVNLVDEGFGCGSAPRGPAGFGPCRAPDRVAAPRRPIWTPMALRPPRET